MSKGFPQFTHSAKQGDLGVNLVVRIVSDAFGWLFKRNHQEHDFGIDGHIELVTDEGAVTSQMIALQIKYGKSFFQEQNNWGYVYRGEQKHFNYLANYPVPVVIVICEPDSKECYWVRFQAKQTQCTDSGWKITVPYDNKLSSSKSALRALVPALTDSLSELQPYWALNKMIIESSSVLLILDDHDVSAMDTSRARNFFDRLCATKELAYECQGKIEINFSGYDDDSRELFEIEEVRQYVSLLDAALPELLFFVCAERPDFTLITFVVCLTWVSWEGERSTSEVTRRVLCDPDKIADFLERNWSGLNEMTDWLGMPIEENKRITYAVLKCLGFNPPESEDDV